MAKTSVGVWSRSIADWDLQRETLWEMMERLATYFLLTTLVSSAEADFTVSSKRDMRWVGVLDHMIWYHIIHYPSNTASWRCGFFLVSASDGLPHATYFVVQQHFPAQCPAKIFRTRNMERDCKIQVKCFHHQYLIFSFQTIQGHNWGSKWAPE